MRTPVRHGEGKFVVPDPPLLDKFASNQQIVVRYVNPKDVYPSSSDTLLPYPICPNASMRNIAGVCDPTGLVFGLMPHPEANHSKWLGATWTREDEPTDWIGEGMAVFVNGVNYAKKHL
jgi:phosphoribosylformylglycinamidine synthase